MTIVTHVSPDWDAIGAVWLLKRYGGFADHDVVFVNTGSPGTDALASAAAVVDTGREYDVTRWRFDHHQLPGQEANKTCATWMVWNWLEARAPIPSDDFDALRTLEDLAKLILNGDTGGNEWGAAHSRSMGIHAMLSSLKARKTLDDAGLLGTGMWMLDLVAERLIARRAAHVTLSQFTVYQSHDGLVRGLQGAPQGATFAAFEEGARLVVFTSEGENTVSVGMMRGGESQEPDCGALVKTVLASCGENVYPPNNDCLVCEELRRWFNHNAGFFSGRGTAKAPDPTPLTADFKAICAALDSAWPR